MMMSSSCVGGCLDAQDPVKVSFVRLYKWPEADAEFLRNSSMEDEKTSSETTGRRRRSAFNTEAYVYHESFASRQRYLRSYTFSKKETFMEKTKRWYLKEKQKVVLVIKSSTKSKNYKLSHGSINGSCNSFLGGVFNVLLSCVATLDVRDDHDE